MTGFARVRKQIAQGEIVLSLKTVNHRGLDLHFHLPNDLDPLEGDLRAILKSGIARGHVQIHVSVMRAGEAAGGQFNRALMESYISAYREAASLYRVNGEPDLNSALRLPGMLSNGAEAELDESVKMAVLEAAREAVDTLNDVRSQEGAATAEELRQRCRSICELVRRMEEIREGAVGAFQRRLRERLAELLHGAVLDPQRLAQEAAVLADRSDVSEELMRLKTHAAQLTTILENAGEIGKRLDFLLQEMNRETNTVLSKTGGLGDLGLTITDLALAAKSEIDKIREQSLNLE
jgi:uncharacterized protein (TIGR00255 family)